MLSIPFLQRIVLSFGTEPLWHTVGRAVWDHATLFKGLWFGEKGECFWVNAKWKHLGPDVPKRLLEEQ